MQVLVWPVLLPQPDNVAVVDTIRERGFSATGAATIFQITSFAITRFC
jgi:hypothetical protein